MAKSLCVDCKFADWDVKSNGALHHNGMGVCTWKKTFAVSASTLKPGFTTNSSFSVREEWPGGDFHNALFVRGSTISRRGSNIFTKCDVFERKEPQK